MDLVVLKGDETLSLFTSNAISYYQDVYLCLHMTLFIIVNSKVHDINFMYTRLWSGYK